MTSVVRPEPVKTKGASCLCQQFLDYVAGDIGETELPPLETEREPGVIQSQQMQDGGVDVMDVDRILHR